MEINDLMSSKSNQTFEIQQTENVQLKRIFKLSSKSLSKMSAHSKSFSKMSARIDFWLFIYIEFYADNLLNTILHDFLHLSSVL
jgi:hypothetical protein